MSNRSETPEKKSFKQPIPKLNYCLKPKLIRNTPLNKYDLNHLQSIDASGAQITDHFNYGFNSETFPVYVKLCKRFVQAQDIEHPNRPYDPTINHQFRFNDDAPIDFGGFGPFLDQQFSDLCNNDQFESLMQCFVTIPFAEQSQKKGHNTMINYLEYLKYDQAYPTLSQFTEEIERKIEEKYQRTMQILKKHEKTVNMIMQKIDSEQLSSTLTEEAKDGNFYEDLLNISLKSAKKENLNNKKIMKKQLKSEESSRSESQDSLSHSLSYSNIQESEPSDESRRKRQKNDRKYKEKSQKKEHKERQSHRHKKKKSKSKKIGKKKSHKSHKKHKKHGKHSKKHKK